MTATTYAGALARAHWAGSNADVDIHRELYEGEIDGSFRVNSLFRESGLTNWRSVQHQSNTWRGDRVGNVSIKGRQSGVKLDQTRIPNEKFIITVDTTSYASTPVDYQDDWTAPDFRMQYVAEHGIAHAKEFDRNHIIKLIHAAQWTAPESLGGFNNGVYDNISSWATGGTDVENAEKDAATLVFKHSEICEKMVDRDLGGSLAEFITLVRPSIFNKLLQHNKLMNVQFTEGPTGNNFARRRMAMLNGMPLVETPRFPTYNTATSTAILGPSFDVTANESKVGMIVFHPGLTLVTVEAQPMTTRYWDDKPEFTNVLDSYCMYTVGVRRGDACAAIQMP